MRTVRLGGDVPTQSGFASLPAKQKRDFEASSNEGSFDNFRLQLLRNPSEFEEFSLR